MRQQYRKWCICLLSIGDQYKMPEAIRSSRGRGGVFAEEYLSCCIDSALLTAVSLGMAPSEECACTAVHDTRWLRDNRAVYRRGVQGQGLGRKLLSHALREMRAQRYRKAFVWIAESNVPAVGFFKRFGFEPDGKRRQDSSAGEGSCELRLRIDAGRGSGKDLLLWKKT